MGQYWVNNGTKQFIFFGRRKEFYCSAFLEVTKNYSLLWLFCVCLELESTRDAMRVCMGRLYFRKEKVCDQARITHIRYVFTTQRRVAKRFIWKNQPDKKIEKILDT